MSYTIHVRSIYSGSQGQLRSLVGHITGLDAGYLWPVVAQRMSQRGRTLQARFPFPKGAFPTKPNRKRCSHPSIYCWLRSDTEPGIPSWNSLSSQSGVCLAPLRGSCSPASVRPDSSPRAPPSLTSTALAGRSLVLNAAPLYAANRCPGKHAVNFVFGNGGRP